MRCAQVSQQGGDYGQAVEQVQRHHLQGVAHSGEVVYLGPLVQQTQVAHQGIDLRVREGQAQLLAARHQGVPRQG